MATRVAILPGDPGMHSQPQVDAAATLRAAAQSGGACPPRRRREAALLHDSAKISKFIEAGSRLTLLSHTQIRHDRSEMKRVFHGVVSKLGFHVCISSPVWCPSRGKKCKTNWSARKRTTARDGVPNVHA